MKRILIDMDDVITKTDWFTGIEQFTKEKLDRSYPGFHLEEILSPDDQKRFFDNFDKINFYNFAELLDDCYEVMEELSKQYDIYICSTFTWSGVLDKASWHLKNKYDYLYKHLPFIHPDKYIFCSNKNIIKADVRIDDRIENLRNGEIRLMFTAWHNKDLSDEYLKKKKIIRVNNWQDIKKILIK